MRFRFRLLYTASILASAFGLWLSAAPLSSQTQASKPPALPKGTAQLKPMYLPHKIFQPDKWWVYEGADDDRPDAYAVEQSGTVTLGGRVTLNHGAVVKYLVNTYADEKQAHAAFLQFAPKKIALRNIHREIHALKQGNEGADSVETIYENGQELKILRQTFVRYGKYVVEIGGKSDMRAFGERPASGQRPWMSDPVYRQAREAALAKWSAYRTLLSAK